MKQKVFKPFLLQMIGLVITQCVMLTYNPLAIGWFGAMATMDKYSIVALPIMVTGMYYAMGTLGAAKYGMVMVAIMFCTTLYRRKNGKVSVSFASFISAATLLFMEAADWAMKLEVWQIQDKFHSVHTYMEILVILMLAVVAGSGSSVFAMAVTGFMGQHIYPLAENTPLSKQINQAIIYNNENISKVANGFKNLSYKIMDLPDMNGADKSEFDEKRLSEQIAGCVCYDCVNSGVCWGAKAEKSQENVMDMIQIAKSEGAISRERLPMSLASQCINQNELVSGVNHLFERARLNFLWRTKIEESRQAVAVQLGEMADIVENSITPENSQIHFDYQKEEYLKQRLKEKKIIAKKIAVMENARGILQIDMTARTKSKSPIQIGTVEKIFSTYMGVKVRAVERDSRFGIEIPTDITNEFKGYSFAEETNFVEIHGVARRTKEQASISGDNYSVMEIGIGQRFLSICDGMGSGSNAYKYSEIVVDLLEQLLKNGFSQEIALRLINSVLMIGNQWDSPAAVDMGLIDLYSGTCNIVKMGAACTYIKRGNWVECLKSTSLPMGAMDKMDIETITKKLYNGDFVIMISDGIVEALEAQDKEAAMGRIIMDIDTVNPKEMANEILSKALILSDEAPKDDMTVLVTSIWDRV